MSTCQVIKKPILVFSFPLFLLTYIQKCVSHLVWGFLTSLCKKNVNINSPVTHSEFSPAPTWKKAFLSVYLCTETQLKAFMLQSQFSAKWQIYIHSHKSHTDPCYFFFFPFKKINNFLLIYRSGDHSHSKR